MPKKAKLCTCGRGEILLGERRRYNARDKDGNLICSQCAIDAILAPFTSKPRATK